MNRYILSTLPVESCKAMETKIRNATLSDIPRLLDFAKHVGRYINADELRTWLQVDPEAMFVAETVPGGKLIGSCCGTRLTPELGFMGLYVVLAEYRGKGIGLKLWKAAKEHLGDRNIGVRGDPVNFRNYTEKDGFSHVENYSILYYECFGDSIPENITLSSNIEMATFYEGKLIDYSGKSRSLNSLNFHKTENVVDRFDSKTICTKGDTNKNIEDSSKSPLVDYLQTGESSVKEDIGKSLPSSVNVENMTIKSGQEGLSNPENPTKQNIEEKQSQKNPQCNLEIMSKAEDVLSGVISFDNLLHKRDRSFIVEQTIAWSSCRTQVAMMEGKVVGYACLRNVVTENWLISPFYADTEDAAEMLLFKLLHEFDFSKAPKGIQIRFPDKNIACKRLAEKFGFSKIPILLLTGFTKQCINVDTSKVYSFHSAVFCSE